MDDFIIATLRYGTPLVYVTMAGVLASRAGIWHLGLEGLMITGACAAVIGLVQTGSLSLALGLAILLCVLGSILLWFVVEKLRANPIIAGLGLTGLGLGGTDLAVQAIYGSQASVNAPFGLPRLGPAFGPYGVLSFLVVLMPVIVFGLWLLINRTAFGVLCSLAGRNPIMVVWQGARLSRLGLAGFVISGALAGLAGTIEVLGPNGRLVSGFLPTHGFTAILIALVASLSIAGVWISGRLRGGAKAAPAFGELRDY